MKGAQKWSSALSRMPEGHPLVAKRAVAMVRGEETMVSPGYCSKETFLKCLRLEVHILPCAAMVGLLRVLPAPTCSQGNSQAGISARWLLLQRLLRAIRGTTDETSGQNDSAFTEHDPCETEATKSRYILK